MVKFKLVGPALTRDRGVAILSNTQPRITFLAKVAATVTALGGTDVGHGRRTVLGAPEPEE